MRRRALLAAVTGGVTLAGCLSETDISTEPSTTPSSADQTSASSPAKPQNTPTAIQQTAAGVTATFRVVDSHAPTEEDVNATFNGQHVTVTGSMDPARCNKPTLESVSYAVDAGRLTLVVGEYSPYGETATVECGNASYDFRCVVTVTEGQPHVIEVTYDTPESADHVFTVDRK
ncbi:hypothetical protein [Haloarcula amylovorans]|uniref:hypothetical protein n=1 Tax=Haloarcula amylovorans TaxID=2562280 RepID=UPI0010766066|nr:hypothetical protein [Halomicroarcula amylolytica]